MTTPPDIRELAQRAELEFHTRPHRLRRRAWWSGVILAIGCCGWLLYAGMIGDHRVYEAGTLSQAHTFIANDCRQCHTTWQPARRLVAGSRPVSSISNASCLKCHSTAEHHANQIPVHADFSCAECHREHDGKHSLAEITDQHCIRCHADLQTTEGPSTHFAQSIRGFSESDGHPQFNLTARGTSPTQTSNLITPAELDALLLKKPQEGWHQRHFLDVLTERAEQGSHVSQPKWRDRGEIKFNHAAHLDPQRIKDKTGKHVDLSRNCQACHVTDSAGHYMLPIKYEQHCAQCHPLWFDNQNYAGDVVPHETPDIVRGFLAHKYTLSALKRQAPFDEHRPARPLPGQADPPTLKADDARRVEEIVAQAERLARDHTRAVTGRGGCKLCHTVQAGQGDAGWTITPPNIPERWMPHSRFDHIAHRMLACAECHGDVAKSRDTADVMLPDINDCRICHVSGSASARITPDTPSVANPNPETPHDVVSHCTLCHTYHRRPVTEPPGQLNKRLQLLPPAP